MPMMIEIFSKPGIQAVFWSLITISLYWAVKQLYRRWPRWWLMPLILAPILIAGLVLLFHSNYHDYIRGTHWLVLLLGPATVAFAIPIYEQRVLIRQYWPLLLIGALAGSLTSLLSSWGLTTILGLDKSLRLSLLPRSISTPFAMEVSHNIGGLPDLTAIFVIITGILGAVIGDLLLARVSFRTALARGALLGLGAHSAGTARAHQRGEMEGAVAGLIMVLAGLLNVIAAPLLSHCLS